MSLSTFRRPALAAALGLGLLAMAVPTASAHGVVDNPQTTRLSSYQKKVIKKATYALRTPQAAEEAGFLPTDECAELPGVGGMGYHYVNPTNIMDGVINPAKPEILVFVPTRDGGRTLGAAEYFQPDADQDPRTTTDRPSLFGQHPFDGPMPGHEAGQPLHYDLHVWLYKRNPAGQLAAWNPNVHCPAQS